MNPSNRHPEQALQAEEIEALVRPMLLQPLPATAYGQLALYVALVERWNRRMNLTAVRDTRELVRLHVAESLRCAQLIPANVMTAMDFGSGAGLPGIPIQIARPDLAVTLAESQTKKAAFLREAVREASLDHASVYAGRVEDMPAGQDFDLVTLRAVDRMELALQAAVSRIKHGGWMAVLTSQREVHAVQALLPTLKWMETHVIPGSEQRTLMMGCK